ncbi:lactoylglutathione lyase [Ornatilinea apprima]|uniref:Lactoylglutathione lyase n=1 Tax=Ornatilinea apprima TaxID=1134406 RepID=A0A0P6WVT5_9CHLR|nr:methylmalonyl-CoA epimerase [Ornatilinea apprima]KPL74376.1 lactoylglutathione lyase [Ornatilinea apprima]
MAKVTKINHIAIAVNNIEESLAFWQGALGLSLSHIEDVPSQKASVAFIPTGDSEVELVRPTDETTGVAKFLKDRGPGMHHLCLEVDDIDGMLEQLKEKGVRLINETAQVLPGRKMAFIHPKSANGVLVELYQITE